MIILPLKIFAIVQQYMYAEKLKKGTAHHYPFSFCALFFDFFKKTYLHISFVCFSFYCLQETAKSRTGLGISSLGLP